MFDVLGMRRLSDGVVQGPFRLTNLGEPRRDGSAVCRVPRTTPDQHDRRHQRAALPRADDRRPDPLTAGLIERGCSSRSGT